MGICGRLLSLYRRDEAPVDKRGKVCLANDELYTIKYTPNLRVRDVCIEIAKHLDIAPVALDFFTLMTTDCEHCLRPNRQVGQQCNKQNDHYLNPKRMLYSDDVEQKVFFFRLAFKAVAGPDLKVVNGGAYEYFVMQCRWDFVNGRINNLSRKDHLTLLVLESIMQAHEEGISCKEVLDNPKRFGLAHLFYDEEYSVREIKSHLKKQLTQFKTSQNNIDKAKNSFLYVLEGVTDFGVTKIIVKKFYYQNASEDHVYPVEWEILVSPSGLKKRRTYKDGRDVDNEDSAGGNRVDEMISDYKDIEYLEIKQSASDEIIHISRQKGFLEVISVGKSNIKKESLITLIEGFYHLFVNQYKTLTKYEPGLELPLLNARQNRKVHIHGPIERKKVEVLLKAVDTVNGNRSGVHMIRRSRKEFDNFILSLIHGSEIKHYEIVYADDKYGIKNGPKFDNLKELLEFYKTSQPRFPTVLTKYCPIPKEGLCALYDDQIVVEAPNVPSTSRPANPEYAFEYIGNQQLERLCHTFTCGESENKVFKARWLKGDNGGCQEVFCRRLETSRAINFREKVVKIGESMAALAHRNLVQFHGVQFNDDQNTHLAFEWINLGTLDDYLKKETEVTVETIINFAAQIAEACFYLHEKNYVHGWLAAHNVLVASEEQVKLSDVSVPCLREEDMLCETVNINRSPWKARECFQGRRYSKESDVWAFGIVLWEMFMKTVPFQNMEDDKILRIFQQDRHLAYPKWCPDEVGKIMKSCWITEPTQRPTFAQIVRTLRVIMTKLTPQEKERKIPETIDEKYTIEPLNIKKDKPSLGPQDDNLPRTSSWGSNDNDDSNTKDVGSNEGSFLTDDSDLDFLPEKESPEMLWSPEEIELKKLKSTGGKYPIPTAKAEQPADVYDRITQNDSFVETNYQTREDESVPLDNRQDNEVTVNETEEEADGPLEIELESVSKNNSTSFENIAETNAVLPTDNDPADDDDENKPLLSKTTPTRTETEFSFPSMDHVGFLASRFGSEAVPHTDGSAVVDNGSTYMDEGTQSMDNSRLVDSDCEISEQGSTSALSETEGFSFGNLDPFVPDSEMRATEIFSKLDSDSTKRPKNSAGDSAVSREGKYVPNTMFNKGSSGYPSGNLNPVKGKKSLYSPYTTGNAKRSNFPTPNTGVSRNSGYTPSRERTSAPARVDERCPAANQQPSMIEFSKLDPFAVVSSGRSECEGVSLNETGLPREDTSSTDRQSSRYISHDEIANMREKDRPVQDAANFSSFLDRDPMSEMSGSQREQQSDVNLQTSKTSNKQSISQSVNKNNATYSSPYSLSSMSNLKSSHFALGNFSSQVPNIPQTSPASSKQQNRSGYVSMRSNNPRPIVNNAEKESAYQKSAFKSHDGLTSNLSFSERDPFSEAFGKVEDQNSEFSERPENLKAPVLGQPGVVPARFEPPNLTGATFENLFSKSREARSLGFSTPITGSTTFQSSGARPPTSVQSPSPGLASGTRVTSMPASRPQSVFTPPPSGKPSLENLVLRLSESRQSAGVLGMRKQPTSGLTYPTASSGPQQNKAAGVYSGVPAPKRTGYVSVSKQDNTDSTRASKMSASHGTSDAPTDLPSLTNEDVFSSILQRSSTEACSTSPKLPTFTSTNALAGKSSGSNAVKLYTEAETDEDPNRHVSAQRNVTEEKAKPGQTTEGLDIKNAGRTRNGANSNYQTTAKSISTNLQQQTVHFSADEETKGGKLPSEKPRAKTLDASSETNVLEGGDILQYTQTSIGDLLSSIGNTGKMNEVKPSQSVEVKDTSKEQDILEDSEGHKGIETDRSGDGRLSEDSSGHEGLTFDPFSEQQPSLQLNLNGASPQEIDMRKSKPETANNDELQKHSVISSKKKEVVVLSYPTPGRAKTQESSDVTNSSQMSRRDDDNGRGNPPGGNGDRNPPLPVRKTKRKVSDIPNDYAQVSIQQRESISSDEQVQGAVGGVEPGSEISEQDSAEASENGTTIVDRFNIPAVEDSIDKLEPYMLPKKPVDASNFEESMKSHLIPYNFLVLGRELGSGAFGVVKKAKLTRPADGHKARPPMEVAVKCCKDDASEIYKNSFKQEAINLMKLDNKFIVRFLGISYDEKKNLLLVTELVPQGSLDKYLSDAKNSVILGNEVLLQFAIQITMGMEYLESKKLVHRDLAARNILVATESHVKISDFGLSRIYDDDYYKSRRENQRLPIRWLAPECLEQKRFTTNSDAWSLGVTLWEMFSYGRRPYEDWKITYTSELIQALKEGKRLAKPSACLDDVYSLILECWTFNPTCRISFFLLRTMLESTLKDKYDRKPYFL